MRKYPFATITPNDIIMNVIARPNLSLIFDSSLVREILVKIMANK
jgi:hypothetical protein